MIMNLVMSSHWLGVMIKKSWQARNLRSLKIFDGLNDSEYKKYVYHRLLNMTRFVCFLKSIMCVLVLRYTFDLESQTYLS